MSTDLQVSGLISGLSTRDIVQRMMAIERLPLSSMETKKSQLQQKKDALRDINTRLAGLLSKIQTLNLRGTVDVKAVTTDIPASSPTLVTATANSDAALGIFTVKVQSLATATSVTSNDGSGPKAVGNAVQANQPLSSAGFGISPTTGTFSVNGAQITIDSSTVLSDGADLVGANTIFAKIWDATAGLAADKRVTVSWGLDANGRQNKLVLNATGTIQLGAGSDTSNFLTAAGLQALPPATTMTSARNLGGVNPTALLNSSQANLSTALAPATGSFKINGVTVTYDASLDTLNTLISRINSSAANVSASFDSVNDRVTLTSRNTGSGLISLEDVTGNFLTSTKLSVGNETVGANASYLLNGQQTYSTSNTVTDAMPGVTINLLKADTGTTVTLTVSQNTSTAVSAVQDFVSQYNSAVNFLRDKVSYNATLKKGGTLMGDSLVQAIDKTLAMLVSGTGDGLSSVARSLSDIGITTGAVGTVVGQAKSLVLDTAKLTSKLQTNPSAVADLFGALGKTVTLQAGGTGSIASIAGNPDNHVSGTYSIVSDGVGGLTSTFTPSGGGSPTTKTELIAAGGTNSTLIPGVVITAKAVLAAGNDTITATFNPKGVGVKIADYLAGLTSVDGVLAQRQESGDKQIEDISTSMQRLEDRLDAREQALTRRFTALEAALSRLQTQSLSISAQLSKLGNK